MALAIPERVERPVPYDLAAEEAVLGSLLLERDAIIKIAPFLRADDFYREAHGWIYAAVLDLYARREPPDTVTLASELERAGRLDSLGGYSYLISLVNRTPTAVHIEYYAHIVERASVLRRLISAGGEIAALGYSDEHDVANVLDKAEQLLFNVSQRTSTKEFASIEQVLNEYYDRIESIQHNPGTVVGVPTGFHDLDEVTGGLQRSDLIIVAARPGIGKTSLVLGIAHNAAMPPRNKRVGVFSLEMSREQLVQRLLAVETGVDSQSLRLGYLNDDEWHLVSDAIGRLAQMPIYIDDSAGLNIHEVRSKARRLEAEVGVDLIIIDYLQLMQGSARKDGNRVQEVSEISRNLKMLAREINVPIIACAQLSRAVESRTSHVPILSDLRESGCLAGETPIYLPDEGVYRPIEQLVGGFGFRVLALNTDTWQLEPRPVLKAFATGTKPVYKLSTRLGRTIRATANHKFLTLQGWQRLDELAPATRIALPRQLPGPAEPSMPDAELALLGHLIGDGCTLARSPIHYTTNDLTLAETVAALATEVFRDAVKPRIQRERDWYQVYIAASYHLTHGVRNPVAAWLDGMGIFNLRSHQKRVPERVFTQPAPAIATFLRHLWSTDGCIHMGSAAHSQPTIYYASSSQELARNVQSLLLRLSINATLHRIGQSGKGRDQYHVVVDGKRDIERFLYDIGALGTSKAEHRLAILDYLITRVANTNRDVLPREVWRLMAVPAMQTAGITSRQMQAALGNSYCGTALYKQNVSRERATRLARAVQSDSLARLAQSDVYWDEITSIEPDGEAEVYDLTVDELHNFVAADILAHNSIEQDADIVMFIHREEMYNQESEKKGIAEIHISKHRNGPLATVPLRFFSQTTKFTDLEVYRQEP
ncbi:MAG TPA: replicative DNA helicase [Chloroflexia bacterium]|jgi:replicative DNA helicase